MIRIHQIATSNTYRVWSRLCCAQFAALAGVVSATSPYDGLCLVTIDLEAGSQAVLDAIRALADHAQPAAPSDGGARGDEDEKHEE